MFIGELSKMNNIEQAGRTDILKLKAEYTQKSLNGV